MLQGRAAKVHIELSVLHSKGRVECKVAHIVRDVKRLAQRLAVLCIRNRQIIEINLTSNDVAAGEPTDDVRSVKYNITEFTYNATHRRLRLSRTVGHSQ